MNMSDGSSGFAQFFEWLLRSSWQSAILIAAVLLAQRLFRRQLNARWRFNLWFLVVLRMILPFPPESALSVFNLVKARPVPFTSSIVKAIPSFEPGEAPVSTAPPMRMAETQATAPQPSGINPVEMRASSPSARVAIRGDDSLVRRNFTLLQMVSWLWLAGVIALSGHVAWLVVRMRRQVGRATLVGDEAVLNLFEDCRAQMGVRAQVRLLETNIVKSPALCGVLRPALLLPPGLVGDFSLQELRYIFLHELAHVKRRDVTLNWFLTALQILHWFNPLAWFGFARMRADRELACDALAISSAREEEARDYGRTIIKLLETLSRPSALPGLVGIMEDRHQMERRIRMIAAFRKTRRWSVLALLLMVILGVTGLTDAVKPASQPVAKSVEKPAGKPAETVTVKVVDAQTGLPLKGASVICPFSATMAFSKSVKLIPVDDGGLVKVPKVMVSELGIGAVHPGFESKAVTWPKFDAQRKPMAQNIPQEYTLKLDRGTVIGGTVKNEEGQPLPNIRVEIKAEVYAYWRKIGTGVSPMEYPFFDTIFGDCPVTDSEGRWQCAQVPKQSELIELKLMRPDNSCVRFHTEEVPGYAPPHGDEIKLADLLSMKAELVARKGIDVRGKVVDAAGAPLPGIKLEEIDGRVHSKPLSVLTSGSDGRFMLPNRDPHQILLKASGPGFAISPAVVDVQAGMPEVRIVMNPPKPLRVRIVNESGEPIAGAQIATPFLDLKSHGKSDSDGWVVWEEGPVVPFTHMAMAPGYIQTQTELGSGVPEQTITLHKGNGSLMNLTVKVQNSEKQPVESFTVLGFREGQTPERIGEGKAGVFTGSVLHEKGADPRFRLKIEVPGFEPRLAQLSSSGSVSITLGEEGKGVLIGVIFLPDGTPAQRALIVMSTESSGGYIGLRFARGKYGPEADGNRIQKWRTDESGRFSFNPPDDDGPIVISHQNGFISTSVAALQKSHEVRLEPWGELKGTYLVNGQPKAGQRLTLQASGRSDGLSVDYYVSTEANGVFAFDKVPPGNYTLLCTQVSQGQWPQFHPFPVEITAGKTTTINYQFAGRRVKGRIRMTPPGLEIDWQKDVGTHLLSQKRVRTPMDFPDYRDFVHPEDFQKATNERRTAGGNQPYPETVQLDFDSDGSFQAEAVSPGTYQIEVNLLGPRPTRGQQWKELGSIKREVVVPPAPDGASGGEVDLGSFEVPIKIEEMPRKPVAALPAQTLEGKAFNLADYRGKCVVVVFWAPWAPPSSEDLLALKAIGNAADPRVAMVGVALEDQKPEELKTYAKDNGLKWIDARLEGRDKTTATEAWGVDTVPAMFLLDSTGFIVARGIKAPRLHAAIEDLLKNQK